MNVTSRDPKQIFLDALERTSLEEQQCYLDQACGGDSALRSRIEGLLRAHGEVGNFLGGPPSQSSTLDLPVSEKTGAQIGRYKLREELAEGGMGVVYVAEQSQPVRRKVALKVIKPGMSTQDVVTRFEAERQALALMDHPNIARVIDGGVTESGLPYFVMELVQGLPITQYCNERHLNTVERLRLCVKVCQAVQHAHQKGIIHRDLKPSNVLVAEIDGEAAPKVIDFGVAKAINQKLSDHTVYTHFSQLVGTPLYMSPEQAGLGVLDIDTRSDVYSLGVMLYELLTGSTPFDPETLKQSSFDEMRRIIRDFEPARPSRQVSTLSAEALSTVSERRGLDPRKLSASLRGELDWIVMKCLEKDRNRRYESASSLAKDIERYLSDEPVEAGPPSAWYRLQKAVRRNKAAWATVAVLAVALTLGVIAVGWVALDRQTRKSQTESAVQSALEDAVRRYQTGDLMEALASARKANELLGYGPVDERLKVNVGEQIQDFEMLVNLEGSLRDFHGASNDPSDRCGRLFAEYGIDVSTLPPQDAATLLRNRSIVIDLAAEIEYWALKMSAPARNSFRRHDVAPKGFQPNVPKGSLPEKLFEIARMADPDPWRQRVRDARDSQDVRDLEDLARTSPLDTLPLATVKTLAITLYFRAPEDASVVDFLRKAQRRHPRELLFNTLLAFSFPWTGDKQQESLGYLHVLSALRPDSHKAPYWIACVHYWNYRYDEALSFLQEAIRRSPLDKDNQLLLASILKAQGKIDQAFEIAGTNAQRNLGSPRANLGFAQLLSLKGETDKALPILRTVMQSTVSSDTETCVVAGGLMWNLGQRDEAAAGIKQAAEVNPFSSDAQQALGIVLLETGEFAEAIACMHKALELNPSHADALRTLSIILPKHGQGDEALPFCRRWLQLPWADNPQGWNDRAWYLATYPPAVRDPQQAIALAQKAVDASPTTATYWNTLGVARYRIGDDAGAAEALGQSIGLASGGDAVDWYFLSMCHWRLGDQAEARRWFDKAAQWTPPNRVPRIHQIELERFRAEAAELLGVTADSSVTEPPNAASSDSGPSGRPGGGNARTD